MEQIDIAVKEEMIGYTEEERQPYLQGQDKISFNIMGICVLRDIFSMHENDAGYEIKKYLNFFAPLFCLDKGTSVDWDTYMDTQVQSKFVSKFIKKCTYVDATKTAFEYVMSEKSDYLLLDMGLVRRDYFRLEDGTQCYGVYHSIYDQLSPLGLLPGIASGRELDDFSEEELDERLKRYADKILEYYPPEKIILFQVRNVLRYYNGKTGKIGGFEKVQLYRRENKWIDKCFEKFRKLLGDCHVVFMPDNVISDLQHKWGHSPLHFTQEYYDYGVEACDIICKEKLTREEERAMLEALRCKYSNLYAERYDDITEDSLIALIAENKKLKAAKERLLKSGEILVDIAACGFSISDFCNENGYQTVGIYGASKVAEYFIAELIRENITIGCIVEDVKLTSKVYDNIPVVPRNTTTYKKLDAIFVTDLISAEKIKEKLAKLTDIPVYSAQELLKK